jgi:hypothetical protein
MACLFITKLELQLQKEKSIPVYATLSLRTEPSLSLSLIYCCTLSVEITSSVTGMMLLGNTSCGKQLCLTLLIIQAHQTHIREHCENHVCSCAIVSSKCMWS